ncbi:hypothetical protein TRIUR3_07092 [Triticum urartu]|uniref:Uncharacterized protein n=1 Tax=Triticum urartu TaxID=4572 RepID=M7YPI9_TRIUA|nr:hypothetical protein TRIUR3_07092 [Triticum urartu]
MPLCCCWMESSSTSPSLLAGSRRGRRHRAARVLNAEENFEFLLRYPTSSERTEDDDISKVGKEDSNSHTSHLAPRHNFRDIEIVHIAEEPSSPKTIDCKHISKLAEPLPDGECFDYAGSINPSMKMRKQRYQKKDEITEGISEIVKKKQYPMKKLNNLYNTLVASSKFRGLRRTRRHEDNDTGGTKIRIGPASTTERELVQCLMPKGKMCKNMMWLLSVALMYDWGSKTKVILDQTIITELLKKPKKCNHPYLCKKLSKLALQNVEQWAMDVFRKEICSVLVYHRFNDLNPRRPEIKKISSSMKTTTD